MHPLTCSLFYRSSSGGGGGGEECGAGKGGQCGGGQVHEINDIDDIVDATAVGVNSGNVDESDVLELTQKNCERSPSPRCTAGYGLLKYISTETTCTLTSHRKRQAKACHRRKTLCSCPPPSSFYFCLVPDVHFCITLIFS